MENNQFGKRLSTLTKTEFGLSIFSTAFHSQENKLQILIVFQLAWEKKQLGTYPVVTVSKMMMMMMHHFIIHLDAVPFSLNIHYKD